MRNLINGKNSTIRLRISCFSALRTHFRGIFPKCDNLLQFTVMIIMSVSMGSSHLHPHCPMIPKLLSFSFTLFCGPCNKSLLIKRLNDFKALLPTHRSHRILNGENSTIAEDLLHAGIPGGSANGWLNSQNCFYID